MRGTGMNNTAPNPTPWLYSGRVGHDVSEGFCSCGGYHYPEDRVQAGTKTVVVLVDGEVRRVEWREPEQPNER